MEEINYRLATDSDTDNINAFYNSVYGKQRDRNKFDWEFNSSPAGKAIYVIAEYRNQVIGTQCVIPYYLVTDAGEVILSGKSEDTLVSAEHRGKSIFEKMYSLLIEACKQNDIQVIWGFTYATKPFLKLGFQIPYRSQMGIMVLNPQKATAYFSSLSSKNTFIDKVKIAGLSMMSWLKSFRLTLSTSGGIVDKRLVPLNTPVFNYLQYRPSFGLRLDKAFVDYRITNNPYNQNYKTCNYIKEDVLLISITYHITEQNIGYIIHTYIADTITAEEFRRFLRSSIKTTTLNTCDALRFWGFGHTRQNAREIRMLKRSGFVFISRGISFVWLSLNSSLKLKPDDFVLSRMASQGTD